MPKVPAIILSEDERAALIRLAKNQASPLREALRARIILGLADGLSNRAVAARLLIGPKTVIAWRRRFELRRVEALLGDSARPGRPRLAEEIRRLVHAARELSPRPSSRELARAIGISASAVLRLWREADARPSQTDAFMKSYIDSETVV